MSATEEGGCLGILYSKPYDQQAKLSSASTPSAKIIDTMTGGEEKAFDVKVASRESRVASGGSRKGGGGRGKRG